MSGNELVNLVRGIVGDGYYVSTYTYEIDYIVIRYFGMMHFKFMIVDGMVYVKSLHDCEQCICSLSNPDSIELVREFMNSRR